MRRGAAPPYVAPPPARPAPRDPPPLPDAAPAALDSTTGADPRQPVDLSTISIAGITRRRVGWVAAGFLALWIVAVFARQVGDASAAAARATQLAEDTAALAAEVRSLQDEVDLVVRPEYVSIAAHGHELGDPREIPFTLSPSVAAPVDGAPGSASVRLGARQDRQTPLESWLSLLFGPGG
jgi:cell division protein FtsB